MERGRPFSYIGGSAAQVPALITIQEEPEQLTLKRPDTLSRLRAGIRATVAPPDDALFQAIAIKLFTDRQLMVDPAIADYLCSAWNNLMPICPN